MTRTKVMTKDCPSCSKMKIDENYLCTWGKGKNPKVLKDEKIRKVCNLVRKGK